MRSAPEHRFTGTGQDGQSAHVKYGPCRERLAPTRRQLVVAGLTIAVAMSNVSPHHADSVALTEMDALTVASIKLARLLLYRACAFAVAYAALRQREARAILSSYAHR